LPDETATRGKNGTKPLKKAAIQHQKRIKTRAGIHAHVESDKKRRLFEVPSCGFNRQLTL
jgi:hypothetical protein